MIKVLVVDDDFMVAKIHTGLVNSVDGFSVVGVAHTGGEAMKAIEELSPTLVLLDIYLPDINGLDLLRKLREIKPDVDVLVISAAREMETVRKALRGGIVHYLMKPFSFDDLNERLEHYRTSYVPFGVPQHEMAQEDVNRLFGLTKGQERRPLPKGCSAETLELVENTLKEAAEPISATETADRLGTSRVSARRYLEYLTEEGNVHVKLKYGGVGRPERLYVWTS